MSRRSLLVGAAAVPTAGLVEAFGIEPYFLQVPSFEVPVEGLPRDLDGYTIAQVTDAHLTELGTVEEEIVSVIAENEVDLVVLTGDIIDAPRRLQLVTDFCALLREAGAQVVATLGNWEHWGKVPFDDLGRAYAYGKATLLVNESLLVDGIRLGATDDSTGGEVRFDSAVDMNRGSAQILLTHSPVLLDSVPTLNRPFDLCLAGHTHGGQVRLTSGFVPFLPPGSGRFVGGFYETPAGRAYVSRGTGTSVVPARFTCRPELPLFRLRQG